MGRLFETIRTLVSQDHYLVGLHAAERLAERGITLPLEENKRKAFHVFPFPKTGKCLAIQLVAGDGHRSSDCRPLSFETKIAKFDEAIPEGTMMQLRVAIDRRGEVHLHISRAGLTRGQTETLFFSPIEVDIEEPGEVGEEQ